MAMPNVDYVDYKGTRYKYAGKALETKAEIDGYYESMAVGLSDNLNSNILEEDQMPYLFRTAGGSMNIGNYEKSKAIVGGTVAWNQLMQNGNFASIANWLPQRTSYTVANNEATVTVTTATDPYLQQKFASVANHKYLYIGEIKRISGSAQLRFVAYYNGTENNVTRFYETSESGWKQFGVIVSNTTAGDNILRICEAGSGIAVSDSFGVRNTMVVDLTLAFGPTIADYIYTLEQATAGAGVAFFKKLFPKPYYAYSAGELISVKTSKAVMTGFNQFDISKKTDDKLLAWATGQPAGETKSAISDYIRVIPGMTYYCNYKAQWCCYDADKNYLGAVSNVGLVHSAGYENNSVTLPADYSIVYIRLGIRTGSNGNEDITAKTDINLNFHWDGERDGEYEEYKTYEYALDSDLDLRGIFKLDANNKLYCDGDTYEPDGTVTRKRGRIDLGTLNYNYDTTTLTVPVFKLSSSLPNGLTSGETVFVCSKYAFVGAGASLPDNDKAVARWNSANSASIVAIRDDSYSDVATFKAAMSGVYLEYDLATPTTENADPYPEVQVVDDWGTEEFVDERAVPIPVGHITQYPANLKAKVEMAPESPDGDGDYVLRQTSGQNEYVPLEQVKELPDYPAVDGEYTLKVTVTGGVATLSWE